MAPKRTSIENYKVNLVQDTRYTQVRKVLYKGTVRGRLHRRKKSDGTYQHEPDQKLLNFLVLEDAVFRTSTFAKAAICYRLMELDGVVQFFHERKFDK